MDLLGQAALLEAFVNKQQRSSREATARAAWLVQQQELAQEEAECEAAWAACCAARLVPGDAAEEDNAPEASLRAALEAADGCVGEALVAAAAVASLLGGHRPPPSSSVGSSAALHQQLRAATARLRQAMAAVDAALLQQGKPRASAAGSRSSECGASSGDLAEQVQRMLAGHPLAAPSCQAQLLQQAAQAEARHAQEWQQCAAALHAFHSSAGRANMRQQRAQGAQPPAADRDSCPAPRSTQDGSADCTDDGTLDGWPAGEHAVFTHARRASLAPGGGGEAALVRRLAAALPSRSSEAVLAHERWHKEASLLQAALQQLEAGWHEEQVALLGAAAALLGEAEAAALAGAQAAMAQLEAASACLRSLYGLEAAQAAQQERQGAETLENAFATAEAAARRFEQWQAKEDYNARLKQLLAQHRQRQAEAAAAAAEAEQQAEAARQRQAAAAAAAGRQRVAYRTERTAAKQAARQQAEAARQAAEARREAALEALRLQAAPAAQRDAARATGPTQSSAAALSAGQAQHGLFAGAMAGLTSEQVLRDQRFKVYEALLQLGLHTTAAGRQAVAAARPARQPRPDTLTSLQRQGLAG